MKRTIYSAEYKTKIVLELLREEKELGQLAAEYEINPNLLRNWKKEFLEGASRVFDESRRERELRKKEQTLDEERDRLMKTIGQLTVERDWLQRNCEQYFGPNFAEKYGKKKP